VGGGGADGDVDGVGDGVCDESSGNELGEAAKLEVSAELEALAECSKLDKLSKADDVCDCSLFPSSVDAVSLVDIALSVEAASSKGVTVELSRSF